MADRRGDAKRALARTLAATAIAGGRPLAWFEELYDKASHGEAAVPWAELRPNLIMAPLFDAIPVTGTPGRGLKVGCGYGDDAEWLAGKGYEVTAFDVAPTAIGVCRKRFSASAVSYVVADLFAAPAEWIGRFDLVWESYTLQVLPASLRPAAVACIARFVAQGGHLVVASRARDERDPEGELPWPLTRAELAAFARHGLAELVFEDLIDGETPPVRRFRACFRRDWTTPAG